VSEIVWILPGCCALICLGVCLPLFFRYKPLRLPLAVAFKSLGTLCALVPALVAALRLDSVYWIFVAATVFRALSDALLEFSFGHGLGVCLLSHLCYTLAFLKLFPLTVTHLILLVGMLALVAWLLYHHRARVGKSILPCAVFGIMLSLMAACGIAGGTAVYGWQGILMALGAAMTFFSDGLLFHGIIFPQSPRHNVLILFTCYLAQLLICGACLM